MKLPNYNKYPKEVHVNEETYQVRFVKRIPQCKSNVVGLCDPEKRIIYIKRNMSKMQTFLTFAHECLHALEFEYDIKVRHKTVYKLEKSICTFLLVNF